MKEMHMKYCLLMMLLVTCLLSGCATTHTKSSPALAGHTRYPGALPSPWNTQENGAINASTMIPAR